ncbi:DUF2195 family protein [Delftia tsuruhatensis]
MKQYAILTILLAGAVFAAHADQITFQNDLSACVSITATKTSTESNVVWANTRVQLRKSIGECGCLSALATYTNSVNRGGVRQVLQEGLIDLGSGGERKLVLATDPALVANKEVRVRLACTGPL